MMRLLPLLLFTACATGGEGVRVLGPEAVEISWDTAYDGLEDGFIAAVQVDLLAYDGSDGSALPGESFVISVQGATLARSEDVVDHGALWNAVTGRDLDVLEATTTLEIVGDDMGAARVVVIVDQFEMVAGCYEAVELVVDAGNDQLSLPISPRMPCR